MRQADDRRSSANSVIDPFRERRRTMRRPVPLAVSLTATLALAAGCTNDPGPPPPITGPPVTRTTAEPEVDITPDPRTVDTQAAIEAFKDFTTASNEVGQDYYRDFDAKVLRYTTGEFRTQLGPQSSALQSAEAHQTGETRVSGFKVTRWEPNEDAANYTNVSIPDVIIDFDVCVDTSGMDVLLPDGTSALQPGTTGRWVSSVTIERHILADGSKIWNVSRYFTDRGRPC